MKLLVAWQRLMEIGPVSAAHRDEARNTGACRTGTYSGRQAAPGGNGAPGAFT